jgi:hypothetical protein
MKIKILLPAMAIFLACNQTEQAEQPESTNYDNYAVFGDTITDFGALPVEQISELLGDKDSAMVKLTGPIDEVCQKKGCWMTISLGDGNTMRVKFKDYDFFMPLNSAGQRVIFEGIAYKEVTPVAELRHYAEDAGKSPEEIEAITEPEVAITFEASGVLLKKL